MKKYTFQATGGICPSLVHKASCDGQIDAQDCAIALLKNLHGSRYYTVTLFGPNDEFLAKLTLNLTVVVTS